MVEGYGHNLFQPYLDNGRHHIAKDKMIAPKQVGGFNMLQIHCQDKSLKLKWLDRLLLDRVNFSLWEAYIISAFVIPITDALRCNIPGKSLKTLLVKRIPIVWKDIFSIWFTEHYISPKCSSREKRAAMLNSLVTFFLPISQVIKKFGHNERFIYEFLAEHNLATWNDFLVNFQSLMYCKPVYADLPMMFIRIKMSLPENWKIVIGDLDAKPNNVKMHRIDYVMLNGFSVKENYNWLLASRFQIPSKAITNWT